MKFKEFLMEKGSSYIIDRDDLILIHNALDDYKQKDANECFTGAVAEAIKIASDGRIKFNGLELEKIIELVYNSEKSEQDEKNVEEIHYAEVFDIMSKNHVITTDGKAFIVDLDITLPENNNEIKAQLKQGNPVIISININDLYWNGFGEISGWRTKNTIADTFKDDLEIDLPNDYLKKIDAGIIPYPTDDMIKIMKSSSRNQSSTNHAILCIGYDSSEKCYICKDVLVGRGSVKLSGLFKIEEKFFFDKDLGKLSVFLHAMSISINSEKEIDMSEVFEAKLQKFLEKFKEANIVKDSIRTLIAAIIDNSSTDAKKFIKDNLNQFVKFYISTFYIQSSVDRAQFFSSEANNILPLIKKLEFDKVKDDEAYTIRDIFRQFTSNMHYNFSNRTFYDTLKLCKAPVKTKIRNDFKLLIKSEILKAL